MKSTDKGEAEKSVKDFRNQLKIVKENYQRLNYGKGSLDVKKEIN